MSFVSSCWTWRKIFWVFPSYVTEKQSIMDFEPQCVCIYQLLMKSAHLLHKVKFSWSGDSRLVFTSDRVRVIVRVIRMLMVGWKSIIGVISKWIYKLNQIRTGRIRKFQFLLIPLETFLLMIYWKLVVKFGRRSGRTNQSQGNCDWFILPPLLLTPTNL